MIIGKLNQRVTVYRLQAGDSDGLGGQEASVWVKQLDTWAHVEQIRSTRGYNVGQLSYDMAYEIIIRSRKQKATADFVSGDFDPLDFDAAAYTGRFNENYSIYHEGRHIILHSLVEKDDRYFKILGYFRGV